MYPSQQNNQSDHTANFFWLLVLIFLAFLGVWYFKPSIIVEPVFFVRKLELSVLLFLGEAWNVFAHLLHLPLANTELLVDLKNAVASSNPDRISFELFEQINVIVGNWLRWPVIAVLVGLAALSFKRHSKLRFRQVHNMSTLKSLERENWPQIEPVLSLDLVKQDLEKGPWAMAKMPLDYAKEEGIASIKELPNKKKVWSIDKGPAARLLSMQLGPLWKDLFNLPIHIKALIVIFIARAHRDRDIAKRFLSQISASAASGKLDFTGVNEQLIQYQDSKVLRWLRPRHAYVRTMMATLLEVARADGVLATAEFLWLKPVDRKLWYTLNSVGRQTSVVEAAGVFAHWKAEKALGRAMTTPMVKEAVKAFDVGVQEILYVSGEDRWHSSEA